MLRHGAARPCGSRVTSKPMGRPPAGPMRWIGLLGALPIVLGALPIVLGALPIVLGAGCGLELMRGNSGAPLALVVTDLAPSHEPRLVPILSRALALELEHYGFRLGRGRHTRRLQVRIVRWGTQPWAVRDGELVGRRLALALDGRLAGHGRLGPWRSGLVEVGASESVPDAIGPASIEREQAVAVLARRAARLLVGRLVGRLWAPTRDATEDASSPKG